MDSPSGSGNGAANRWQGWLALGSPILLSVVSVIVTLFVAVKVLEARSESDREARDKEFQAFATSTNSKFEALSLRIGNQDALINSISNLTSRLDERLSGMVTSQSEITKRRDAQLDALEDSNGLTREALARISGQLDNLLASQAGASRRQ